MKRLILAAALASAALSAQAESTDRWFNDGMAWYEHPCGLSAFEKYGQDDKAQLKYREALLHFPGDEPSGCRKRAKERITSQTVAQE